MCSRSDSFSRGSTSLGRRARQTRPASRADLLLVRRCSGQDRERRELPAITVRGDRLPGCPRLGEVRVAVGERGHTPAHHARTARCLPADREREPVRDIRRRSSRAISPRRRYEMLLPAVTRCSAVSQSKHVGPGGIVSGAATTSSPQSATDFPWPAASPTDAAGALTRWSRPSTVLVTVAGRVLLRRRTWSTVGIAQPFHHGWGCPGLGGCHRRDLLRYGLAGQSGRHYSGSAVQLLCPHIPTHRWSRDSLLSAWSDENGLPAPYRRTCPVLRYVRRLPRGWP